MATRTLSSVLIAFHGIKSISWGTFILLTAIPSLDKVLRYFNNLGQLDRMTFYFEFPLQRKGSVIASLNITYVAVDSLQIVFLQEEMAEGRLGDNTAELLNIISRYGK